MNQIQAAEQRIQRQIALSKEFDESKHPRADDGKFSYSAGHRVAINLAQHYAKQMAKNGFALDSGKINDAWRDLSDEDRVDVIKELKSRGLTSISPRKKQVTIRDINKDVDQNIKRHHEDHTFKPTNRHIPFEDSPQYHAAMHGTSVHRSILHHLSEAGEPVELRDLADLVGHKAANVYGGENPLKNKYNSALIELLKEGKIETDNPQWGTPRFWIKKG